MKKFITNAIRRVHPFEYKRAIVIAFLLTISILSNPVSAASTMAWIYPSDSFPGEFKSLILLIFRVCIGVIFVGHGYPKLTHLKQWSESLNNMPIFLCFIGAATMFFGGFCLAAGFLTPLVSLGILGSMAFALWLELKEGTPFLAKDPYLTPPEAYKGPDGKGEGPSTEKAVIYILIMLVFIVFGPGLYSIDALLFPNLVF